MAYNGIREWLGALEKDGDLKHISGASWDLEMSGICEILYREGKRPLPALLFDNIPGYPEGYRTLYGFISSPRRLAKALYIPLANNEMNPLAVAQSWHKKAESLKLITPRFVDSGPVQENFDEGDNVNLMKFPTPRFHEADGGRYIGTAHAVIQGDPDSNWVNLGVYRCMLVDHNHIALHIVGKKHGRHIFDEKYFSKGKVMPVAIAIGIDPALWFASGLSDVPFGVSEYDYAGGIRGEPLEVIKGPFTGFPVPANAEIVIEGECHPDDLVDEGPFGEWCGYYANLGLAKVPEPVIRVKDVLYRNNPILTCSDPAVPPSEYTAWKAIEHSAMIWGNLEREGVPGIKGVWCHEEGGGTLFNAISIHQMYAGHAMEVGLIAAARVTTVGRYTVVVDEDIDPSNLSQVIWAVATRADPERIQILKNCRSSSIDTTISPEEKRKWKLAPKPLVASRAIIDACQPYQWKSEWYPSARISPEMRLLMIEKWDSLFKEMC